jgi:ubiquinone/menaquinone biosynthesis C-methylase UbiE
VSERFAPVHDGLVAELAPAPGEQWLDVATGTGGVAIRAAQAGAIVTALDITPELLAQGEAKARAAGLDVRFVEGNAESLPYPDGDFDVVSSCFGVIFAPDRVAAARELGRVCRAGGRLGLTVWRPFVGMHVLCAPFVSEPPPNDPEAWGTEDGLHDLLDGDYELDVQPKIWVLETESLDAHYEWLITSVPPLAAFMRGLEPARHEEFREHFMEVHAEFVQPDGHVREGREYLLVLGRRRP